MAILSKIKPAQIFMISVMVVNAGNYVYNLILGRLLGPEQFSDAAILITFLLVLSFIAMTFQLVTAKFSIILEHQTVVWFRRVMYKYAIITGLTFGALIILFAQQLQLFFNTSTSEMFFIFGLGIPIYFIMSINRGFYQGQDELKKLSVTYQSEMLSRLIFTLAILLLLNIQSSIGIAYGILISFFFGLIPIKISHLFEKNNSDVSSEITKPILNFFLLTAFYELTQIIINNSDILLVKHYFNAIDAGLYASLALIGRMVYFIAWMFVMLLLPNVVRLKKAGKNTKPILFKYVIYISCISISIIASCYLFPKTIVHLFFGEQYLPIAPLLWKYGIATSMFAIANIFAYYYLSLDKYIPVVITGILGLSQVILIIFYHNSLEQVVSVQIIAMIILLLTQVAFFIFSKNPSTNQQIEN